MADRRAAKLVTGTALAVLALLAAGCTEGSPKAGAPPVSASASATKRAAEVEAAQGTRAQAALELLAPGEADAMEDPDGPQFVESGLERVAEGLHHLTRLKKGPYQLYVACVGEGSVQVVASGGPARTVRCDGAPAAQRVVVDAPEELKLDIAGVNGASGMFAWELAALSPDGGVRVQ
ncbi:hypothetical protein [Streptomyces sp. NPDC046371]|uniref:hypothetical protein n=1 Tax=unclassified Streptomyces TaxID=2593676 RepID=UPI0034026369